MTTTALDDAITAVNSRLKHGEGSIYFTYKEYKGERKRSQSLYLKFYVNNRPVVERANTADPEIAYQKLLRARNLVQIEGRRHLPSEIAKIRYEDLRQILVDNYRDSHVASLYERKNKKTGETEWTFQGADAMDKFFRGLPITAITGVMIQNYVRERRKKVADPSIRKELNHLQRAFSLARELDIITAANIPPFILPKDSAAREGFIEPKDFETLKEAMVANITTLRKHHVITPTQLRMTLDYLYLTGTRIGEAEQINIGMVSSDNSEIVIPPHITKTKKGRVIPLKGALSGIGEYVRELRKSFPPANYPVFCFRNFRKLWCHTCLALGRAKHYDAKTGRYDGLRPHDLRRSAARNLAKATGDRRTAMMITGHKTEFMFERYNIKTTEDAEDALIKLGNYKASKTVKIDEAQR